MELTSKFNTAKVFLEELDSVTLKQIQDICNLEHTKGSKLRFMPDCHAGKGAVIGTTMTLHDTVVPNFVGVDIGCGMLTINLTKAMRSKLGHLNLDELDTFIHRNIRTTALRKEPHALKDEIDLAKLKCVKKVDIERAYFQIGTLGSGNHFIEVDKDEKTGELYLIIHSGSRHLGTEVCGFYQKRGFIQRKEEFNALREEGLKNVPQSEKEQALKQYDKEQGDLSLLKIWQGFCTGDVFDDYIHDMAITQHFASLNRQAIATDILASMGLELTKDVCFDTIHNYIDVEHMILRKGAVSSQLDEILLIPLNMRDGSFICKGKGNPDWNYSAPHGAGRRMSRFEAKEKISLEEYKKTMEGIKSTTVNDSTIDEAPQAYKDTSLILNHIRDTVEVISWLKPVYNFKGA